MSSVGVTTNDVQPSRIIGQVKWFNNKAGYGFITVASGENKGKDIFVHYSAIRVVNSQYKYLVQGEYVEFNLVKSSTDEHEYQAIDISGINNGTLMCETRNNTVVQQSTDVNRDYPQKRGRFQSYRLVSRSTTRFDSTSPSITKINRVDDSASIARSVDGDFKTVQRRRSSAPRKKNVENNVSTAISAAV